MKKKTLLSIGTLATIVSPIIAVVSCSSSNSTNPNSLVVASTKKIRSWDEYNEIKTNGGVIAEKKSELMAGKQHSYNTNTTAPGSLTDDKLAKLLKDDAFVKKINISIEKTYKTRNIISKIQYIFDNLNTDDTFKLAPYVIENIEQAYEEFTSLNLKLDNSKALTKEEKEMIGSNSKETVIFMKKLFKDIKEEFKSSKTAGENLDIQKLFNLLIDKSKKDVKEFSDDMKFLLPVNIMYDNKNITIDSNKLPANKIDGFSNTYEMRLFMLGSLLSASIELASQREIDLGSFDKHYFDVRVGQIIGANTFIVDISDLIKNEENYETNWKFNENRKHVAFGNDLTLAQNKKIAPLILNAMIDSNSTFKDTPKDTPSKKDIVIQMVFSQKKASIMSLSGSNFNGGQLPPTQKIEDENKEITDSFNTNFGTTNKKAVDIIEEALKDRLDKTKKAAAINVLETLMQKGKTWWENASDVAPLPNPWHPPKKNTL